MKPIYVTKPFLPPLQDFMAGVAEIWDSHILTNYGPKTLQLQEKLKGFLRVDNLSLFVNGHQALETAITSLGLTGEVITTPFTFASTAHAIVRAGLKPVFCDIRADTYNIDESKIEALITKDTSAILAVHVYGTPCEVSAIDAVAKKHNLKVVYDAAHAFGVNVGGKGIGTFGDISMFSFHATKVFNTIEGGALTYNDHALARDIYLRQNFGIADAEDVVLPGTNAKMNEFQALMGILNLQYFNTLVETRVEAARIYRERLSHLPGVTVFTDNRDLEYNRTYPYYPILIGSEFGLSRDELAASLNKLEIFPRKYFYPLVTDYRCYRDAFDSSQTPMAKKVSAEVLCLPMWGEITAEITNLVCDSIVALSKNE